MKDKKVPLAGVSVNKTVGYYSLTNITCAFKFEMQSVSPFGTLTIHGT